MILPLVFGIAGAVIGALSAKALGIALITAIATGYLIGSTVGSLLFPPELPDVTVTGPRLGDRSVSTSKYGSPIPRCYGTLRLGGEVVWIENNKVREVKKVKTTTSGGKGGGGEQKQTTITYNYYGTFRVNFAVGEATDVLKIWADTKLIYDKLGSSGATPYSLTEEQKAYNAFVTAITGGQEKSGMSLQTPRQLKMRFYPGTENQKKDDAEVADRGDAPAYRGIASIVFDNMPLKKFGNRIPSITAMVSFTTAKTYLGETVVFNSSRANFDGERMAFDPYRNYLYIQNSGSDGMSRISIPSMVEDFWVSDTELRELFPTRTDPIKILAVDPVSGDIFGRYGSANNTPIVKIDGDSLRMIEAFPSDFSTSIVGQNQTGSFAYTDFATVAICNGPSGGTKSFLLTASLFDDAGILDVSDMSYVWGSGQSVDEATVDQTFVGEQGLGFTDCWWAASNSSQLSLYKTAVKYDGYTPADLTLMARITPSNVAAFASDDDDFSDITSFSDTSLWSYDPDNDQLIGGVKASANNFIIAINASSGAINWIRRTAGNTLWSGKLGDRSQDLSVTSDFIVSYSNEILSINKATGEVTYSVDNTNSVDTYDTGAWSSGWIVLPYLNAVVGKPSDLLDASLIYLPRSTGSATSVKDVVDDIQMAAGVDISLIDNTDLASINTIGYMVTRQSEARAALQPLQTAYFFDIIESDWQIKGLRRGKASVASITQSKLMDVTDGDPFPIDRSLDIEVPMRVGVQHIDPFRDFDSNNQLAKRIIKPDPTVYSTNEINIQLPIVMGPNEAAQTAEKILYSAWVERESYNYQLPQEYLKLDPADVTIVTLDDGNVYENKIFESIIGADYSIKIKAVKHDSEIYTSTATGDSGWYNPQVIEDADNRTELKVHDLPLLNDAHDQARQRSVVYLQAGPLKGGVTWQGCNIFQSTNAGATWTFVGEVVEPMSYGSVIDAVAAPPNGAFAIDDDTQITLWFRNQEGELSSISDDELLAGEDNLILIGNELINFRDVTDNGNGSYTISHLMRGRRGTDVYCDSHVNYEKFYIIEDNSMTAVTLTTGQINTAMQFKAVGYGLNFEEISPVYVTPTGADLKPYAPIHAVRTDDNPTTGDITISWERRTRINGDWNNGTGTTPLEEDTESYEVDILDASGGNVVQTLTSTTTSVEYDSADVTYDFGTAPTTLYCRIYQMSAQVGRGFSYEYALEN